MIEYKRLVAEKGYVPDDANRDIAKIREAVLTRDKSDNRGKKRPISPIRKGRAPRSKIAKSSNPTARASTWREEWDDNREESNVDQSWGHSEWDQHDWWESGDRESYVDRSWNQDRFDALMDKHGIDEVGRHSLQALTQQGWRGERSANTLMEKLSYKSPTIRHKSHWLHSAITQARHDIYESEEWEAAGWVDNPRWY